MAAAPTRCFPAVTIGTAVCGGRGRAHMENLARIIQPGLADVA